ncbi:MAG: PadR family transcriptional regulator [Acidobacteria bacterium]|nr:PadR family transcriptional regulator [Acidobacteriota bacterium]
MSLDHILLGMLAAPASGYDVKRGFSEGSRHFWSAELSQIYPALKKLEERGWLESRLEPPARGPRRRVYHRTAEGRTELIRWLTSGPQMGTQRFAYVAQLCFMHELDDLEATSDFMLELRSRLGEFLALLQQAELDIAGPDGASLDGLSGEDFHVYLAVRMGVRSLRSRVDWCDEALAHIERRRRPRTAAAAPEAQDQQEQQDRKERRRG